VHRRVVLGFVIAALLIPGAVLAALWAAPRQADGTAQGSAQGSPPGMSVRLADGLPAERIPPGGLPVTSTRVATRDGQLSFVPPPGWRFGECPSGADSCIEVSPTAVGGSDSVDVLVATPPPGVGVGLPGTDTDRLIVDGRPAVRLDLISDGSVVVYGPMPAGNARFMVSCRYLRDESAIRDGCDRIVKSLLIH